MAELIIVGLMIVLCYVYTKKKADEKYERVCDMIDRWEEIKQGK